ncbi:polysaccharide deacetylase family protein [Streptomyces caniscabiei]|uniref:Polysaccharide deacetylase family protein n=1 Tax=Streptomyces caniscabiei TaxID=2746961 RepID=A0A927KYE7_9ACTN|nr:polysaccharide deacetylase family protein [Streptomyces caniscabiei]MBD9722380.1 polysaccharide deacetylase family protein [Streptomyces caniscabiei]MDX3514306.1 polysaccharide deacetylase family protein [Streptomyces caniscabiei]MDX3716668.1 polysaccharide deacetylase family protein [Streptomyces caniscabiei]MDX3730830.1 polysaccharide deacetylase family protein [Streptomyces caniscabiei]WEO22556.1 polysaccharide deacetylase family protein [Streptomyces caniscabiei]
MTKDQMLTGRSLFTRRHLLTGTAALLGAAGTAGTAALLVGDGGAGPAPAGGPAPAAGPVGRPAIKPSAYRLEPIAGYGPRARRRTLVRAGVRHEPFLRVDGRGRSMVLTFDDGPDPRYTPDILRILRDHDVRAMFFVCGEMAVQHQDLLREMADDGHVVGNHTWTHPLLTTLSRSRVHSEMARTSEIIEKAAGEPPLWFRAPYGAWNRAAFRFGAELGMEPLGWTVDTLDWRRPGAHTIAERVEDGAGPGVVVLSHDAGGDRSQSVAALRDYLPGLLEDGYRITVPQRQYVYGPR